MHISYLLLIAMKNVHISFQITLLENSYSAQHGTSLGKRKRKYDESSSTYVLGQKIVSVYSFCSIH